MNKIILTILILLCLLFSSDKVITRPIGMLQQSQLRYKVAVEEVGIGGHLYLIFQSQYAVQAMSVIHAEHCECKR